MEKLFIPFMMSGDPTPELTIELAYTLQQSGADVIELGVPYSDPLADGPTIQRAASRALAQGMNIQRAMELVPNMRKKGVEIPIVLFTYYNPVLQYGIERLMEQLQAHEIDALLVPDIPLEQRDAISGLAEQYGIPLISLVAPNSAQRVQTIVKQASGFLYCVSSLGVTGERTVLNPDIVAFLAQVKRHSHVPVAVGFGISTNEQVKSIFEHADGVIIGSKMINIIEEKRQQLVQEETREMALQQIKREIMQLVQA
ncbi:tryptophan synthase subunit alpha [Pontibacillus litoralis JSM 072002]|uniref:Tryptophan synthase alpha chain n=2 Tax=Pontibacillus TaxID=289201 RepID=A0A0A5GAK4_9BACI|nr:tryptophan synthase subunit alpha [Pontibacillus litoralis JSM 072002]